ncbi:terminase [Mycobacterium marinum]|uniref:terminase n=1 Tax=Mycobacterium marinum TaxID=1781 RepID=UPI00235934C3|nr:terminase [Mycobacterium marinum]MDC9015127.1 terminase [Mycobacterium marinum]
MAKQAKPSAPAGLKPAGKRLWDAVVNDYELDEWERSLLVEACRTADTIDALQSVIDTLGVDCAGKELAEIRQQRLVYARLLAALRMPAGDETDQAAGRRPQRRVGVRGVYGIAGA